MPEKAITCQRKITTAPDFSLAARLTLSSVKPCIPIELSGSDIAVLIDINFLNDNIPTIGKKVNSLLPSSSTYLRSNIGTVEKAVNPSFGWLFSHQPWQIHFYDF